MHPKDPFFQLPLNIGYLEHQVETLIGAYTKLRAENTILIKRQETLAAEKAALIEKNETARTRVEALINRLKSMENGL